MYVAKSRSGQIEGEILSDDDRSHHVGQYARSYPGP